MTDALPPLLRPDTTWAPVDLGGVLDGTVARPHPSIGRRGDGTGVLYAGKVHSVSSETEAGKTWLALALTRDVLEDGGQVLYFDFEDNEHTIVGRLVDVGTNPGSIRDGMHYVRPAARPGAGEVDALCSLAPRLVILDGVTEAMTLLDLNPMDNVDAAAFGRRYLRAFKDTGAAVLACDHVTKAHAHGSRRYAIGAVHKLNGLDGAGFVLESVTPFGRGLLGRSRLEVTKDRPGAIREHSLGPRRSTFATLIVDARNGPPVVSLDEPSNDDTDANATILMERVQAALTHHPEGLSQRRLREDVQGKAIGITAALSRLIQDGVVTAESPHRLVTQ